MRGDVLIIALLAVVLYLLLRKPAPRENAPNLRVRMGPHGASFDYASETNAGGRCCG